MLFFPGRVRAGGVAGAAAGAATSDPGAIVGAVGSATGFAGATVPGDVAAGVPGAGAAGGTWLAGAAVPGAVFCCATAAVPSSIAAASSEPWTDPPNLRPNTFRAEAITLLLREPTPRLAPHAMPPASPGDAPAARSPQARGPPPLPQPKAAAAAACIPHKDALFALRRPFCAHLNQNEMETCMPSITKEKLIDLLNEDLAREYQAIIAYVNYSQVLKGAEYMNIAKELEKHAKEELGHALKLSFWIDFLGGMPAVTPKPVKTSEKAKDMLRFDLDNEKETIRNYRRRVRQADELDQFALSEDLREILRDEADHLNSLATALGEDTPDPGIADA